ncbi:hypothetical protein ABZP36_014568 [Zizania latifolia]
MDKLMQVTYDLGDDDVRWTMMKLFVESNFTAVSTGWMKVAGPKDMKASSPSKRIILLLPWIAHVDEIAMALLRPSRQRWLVGGQIAACWAT